MTPRFSRREIRAAPTSRGWGARRGGQGLRTAGKEGAGRARCQPCKKRASRLRFRAAHRTAPLGGPSRPVSLGRPHLIRLAKFPNVIDRKRILPRYAVAKLAPLGRANAGAFHGRFGAFNDFADWLAVLDLY